LPKPGVTEPKSYTVPIFRQSHVNKLREPDSA
jgi:hypothetical protein